MRSAAVTLALTIATLLPAPADAKWTQVRSANFVFVGDAPEGQIRRIAQKLEQFREVMLRELQKATDQLGPLLARGRDPRVREQARELRARIGDMRSLSPASHLRI